MKNEFKANPSIHFKNEETKEKLVIKTKTQRSEKLEAWTRNCKYCNEIIQQFQEKLL